MKTTPFTHFHEALGARMAPFAGYNMPIEYPTGIKEEHLNVRNKLGVFDVSHMGEFWIKGPKAFELVQKLTTNDVAALIDGKVQYSCFPNDKGGIVDDLLVYRFSAEKYLLVVNAANIEKDWNWVVKYGAELGMKPGVELENASDNICQLAIQGPLALKAMQKELDLMNTVVGSVLESTDDKAAENAKVNVNNAMNNLRSAIDSCETSVSNMQGIYKNNLVPQMQKVLTNMSDSLNQVTNLVNTLSNTVKNVGVVMEGVGDTVSGTSESLGQIKDVVDNISAKLTDLTEKLDGASEEEMMDILVRFLGGDPDSLGAYFASPVTMETIAMYPVATYGSAMTPFYSTLAIWVGSTILVALVKVKASPKGLENVQSYQLYFGRYLLFFLLAQIQAAIIVAGDLWLLKVNIVEPGLFFLAASFTATAFSLLIYSLTLAFGDVGKAVCVIVMVLQIAGSSGTFPIELLPDTYQKIYIFFPFPYAIRAMREALAGMYGTAYMEALAKLSLFMIEGLLIGLVIRIPFVKLNHFVEERMEDTELM